MLNFTVAVGNRRRAEAGVTEETPMYFDCVLFGVRADGMARILRKGSHVSVQGSLRQSSFEREGIRVYKVEIAVTEIDVTGRAAQSSTAGAPDASRS